MARLLVEDKNGWITADIEVHGAVRGAGLPPEDAEAIVSCAIILACCVLAADDPWPADFLETMARFMSGMDRSVRNATLM